MADQPVTTESVVDDASPKEAPDSGGQISDETIREALCEVYDPEIGIDIVSLGLVYGTTMDDQGKLTVDMTLTSPYCPMGGLIQDQVSAICAPLPGVEQVQVNFVFKPPWDPRTMASDEAKLDLGIY